MDDPLASELTAQPWYFPRGRLVSCPQIPLDVPFAGWPRLVGDGPTLGWWLTLAMPCVGLNAFGGAQPLPGFLWVLPQPPQP